MSLKDIEIQLADWPDDKQRIKEVRRKVFVIEQGVEPQIEWDGKDDECLHVIAVNSQLQVVGTGRMMPRGQIGRLAVLPNWRGRGIGQGMLNALIQAAQRSQSMVYLNAQVHAIGFYESFGFIADGPVFMVAGITHQRMELHFRNHNRQTDQLQHNDIITGLDDNYQATLQLCRSARLSIDIFTSDLDRRLLSRGTLIELLKKFIVISPRSKLRVLVHDPSIAIRYDHRLIELGQQFSTFIEVRKTHTEYLHLPYSYILVDSKSCLYRAHSAEYQSKLQIETSQQTKLLQAEFDEIWSLSSPVSDLKRLFI